MNEIEHGGNARGKEETAAAREQDRRGCDILSVIQMGAGFRRLP